MNQYTLISYLFLHTFPLYHAISCGSCMSPLPALYIDGYVVTLPVVRPKISTFLGLFRMCVDLTAGSESLFNRDRFFYILSSIFPDILSDIFPPSFSKRLRHSTSSILSLSFRT